MLFKDFAATVTKGENKVNRNYVERNSFRLPSSLPKKDKATE